MGINNSKIDNNMETHFGSEEIESFYKQGKHVEKMLNDYIENMLPEADFKPIKEKNAISLDCLTAFKAFDKEKGTSKFSSMVSIIKSREEYNKELLEVLEKRKKGDKLTISPDTYKRIIEKCDATIDIIRVDSELDKQLKKDKLNSEKA